MWCVTSVKRHCKREKEDGDEKEYLFLSIADRNGEILLLFAEFDYDAIDDWRVV